jgi:hypothetical protein
MNARFLESSPRTDQMYMREDTFQNVHMEASHGIITHEYGKDMFLQSLLNKKTSS